tara:strand:- start:148 stop:459 length:312 start_codon:yes stop_codon:yes gene_type:complete
MNKTSKINQIAIDKSTNLVYNTDMTNNKGNNDMINATHNVRVIKHINGNYDTYANFTTVQNALHHMRRMNFANDSWYIIDANDNRLKMNNQGKLVVFNSLIGY